MEREMGFQYGDELRAHVTAPLLAAAPYRAANLVNDYGMKEQGETGDATHDNHPQGSDMWMLSGRTEDFEIIFDFQGFYPLGNLYIWNYNRKPAEKDYTLAGIRNVKITYSLNGADWHKAHAGYVTLQKAGGKDHMPATNMADGKPFCFAGQTARYVKLTVPARPGVGNYDEENVLGDSYGLSKVRFTMGEGFAVVRDENWSAIMQNNDGWTGSDGVFTIPMDGREVYGSGCDTAITFGDTLIDHVDPVDFHRSDKMHMLHNSCAFVPGSMPDLSRMDFCWGRQEDGSDTSLLNPPTSVFNDASSPGYYWPQDSVLVEGKCYTYPLTIHDWPEGPEGFQFTVDGVAMVISPVEDGRIRWEKAVHHKTNLYYETTGKSIYYGGCVFPNTKAAGMENPDGYIYLLGTIHEGLAAQLCIARTLEPQIENGFAWRFYDGEGWTDDIARSAPLAKDVSCELSLSKITGKLHAGEYLLVYQQEVNSPIIAYRTAPAPWGPFSEAHEVYFTEDVCKGCGIYTYNAKAHPHLSPAGEYLVSYNVNTISWQMHMAHGDICRPRFIRLQEVCKKDL